MFSSSKIFSAILSVVFLVTSTGFSLTRHTCIETGRIHVSLSKENKCCKIELDDCCGEQIVTFGTLTPESGFEKESSQKCCVSFTKYLKPHLDYLIPIKQESAKNNFRLVFRYSTHELYAQSSLFVEKRVHAPPRNINPRDNLFQHCILLI